MHGEFSLLLAFDSDDTSFTRGFEAGRLWALACSNEEAVDEMIHAANAEMAIRIAEATHRPFAADVLDGEWLNVRMGAQDSEWVLD